MPTGIYLRTEKYRNSCKGHVVTEKTRRKISISLLARGGSGGMTGKHHSIDMKRKSSIAHKGQIPWAKGKHWHLSDITKQKISRGNKGKRRTLEMRLRHREYCISHPNKKFNNSKIEQRIAIELERRGFVRNEDFFQNFGIKGIKNVDFYLPKLNAVIECDGCYWHHCKIHGSLKHHVTQPTLDYQQTKQLENKGYRVFRFWEHDINYSIKDCIDKIFIIDNRR